MAVSEELARRIGELEKTDPGRVEELLKNHSESHESNLSTTDASGVAGAGDGPDTGGHDKIREEFKKADSGDGSYGDVADALNAGYIVCKAEGTRSLDSDSHQMNHADEVHSQE